VFGLNALGAVSIGTENGFTYHGFEGGCRRSFGRMSGAVQYGVQKGEFALYLAAQGLRATAGATSRRPSQSCHSAGRASGRKSIWSPPPPAAPSA
jgi:hypothetical protein